MTQQAKTDSFFEVIEYCKNMGFEITLSMKNDRAETLMFLTRELEKESDPVKQAYLKKLIEKIQEEK